MLEVKSVTAKEGGPAGVKAAAPSPPPSAPPGDGWQLLGFLQYDAAAYPAFFHRTMDKWSVDQEPWPAHVVTGPLPYRSVRRLSCRVACAPV